MWAFWCPFRVLSMYTLLNFYVKIVLWMNKPISCPVPMLSSENIHRLSIKWTEQVMFRNEYILQREGLNFKKNGKGYMKGF